MIRGSQRIAKCSLLQQGLERSLIQLEDFLMEGRGEVGSSIIFPKTEDEPATRWEYKDDQVICHHSIDHFETDNVGEVGHVEVFNFFDYMDAMEEGRQLPDLEPLTVPVPPREVKPIRKGVPWLVQHEREVLRMLTQKCIEKDKIPILVNPSRSAIYNGIDYGIVYYMFSPCFSERDPRAKWQDDARTHADQNRMIEVIEKGPLFKPVTGPFMKKKMTEDFFIAYGGSQGWRQGLDVFESAVYLMPTFDNLKKTGALTVTYSDSPNMTIVHQREDREAVNIGLPYDMMLSVEATARLCSSDWMFYWYCGRGEMALFYDMKNPKEQILYMQQSVDYQGIWEERSGQKVLKNGNYLVDVDVQQPYWLRRIALQEFLTGSEQIVPLGGSHVFDQDTWDLLTCDIPRVESESLEIHVVEEMAPNRTIFVVSENDEIVPVRAERKEEGLKTCYRVKERVSGNYFENEIHAYLFKSQQLPDWGRGNVKYVTPEYVSNMRQNFEHISDRSVENVMQELNLYEPKWKVLGYDVVEGQVLRVIPSDFMQKIQTTTYVYVSLIGRHRFSFLQLLKSSGAYDVSFEQEIENTLHALIWNPGIFTCNFVTFTYDCNSDPEPPPLKFEEMIDLTVVQSEEPG